MDNGPKGGRKRLRRIKEEDINEVSSQLFPVGSFETKEPAEGSALASSLNPKAENTAGDSKPSAEPKPRASEVVTKGGAGKVKKESEPSSEMHPKPKAKAGKAKRGSLAAAAGLEASDPTGNSSGAVVAAETATCTSKTRSLEALPAKQTPAKAKPGKVKVECVAMAGDAADEAPEVKVKTTSKTRKAKDAHDFLLDACADEPAMPEAEGKQKLGVGKAVSRRPIGSVEAMPKRACQAKTRSELQVEVGDSITTGAATNCNADQSKLDYTPLLTPVAVTSMSRKRAVDTKESSVSSSARKAVETKTESCMPKAESGTHELDSADALTDAINDLFERQNQRESMSLLPSPTAPPASKGPRKVVSFTVSQQDAETYPSTAAPSWTPATASQPVKRQSSMSEGNEEGGKAMAASLNSNLRTSSPASHAPHQETAQPPRKKRLLKFFRRSGFGGAARFKSQTEQDSQALGMQQDMGSQSKPRGHQLDSQPASAAAVPAAAGQHRSGAQDAGGVLFAAKRYLRSHKDDPTMAARLEALGSLQGIALERFVEVNIRRRKGQWNWSEVDPVLRPIDASAGVDLPNSQPRMPVVAAEENLLPTGAPPVENEGAKVPAILCRPHRGSSGWVPVRPGANVPKVQWTPSKPAPVARSATTAGKRQCAHLQRSKLPDSNGYCACLDCGELLYFDGWCIERLPE